MARQKRHSEATKAKAVQMIEEGMNQKEVAKKYKVSPATISSWVRKAKTASPARKAKPAARKNNQSAENALLRQQVSELEEQVKTLKKALVIFQS